MGHLRIFFMLLSFDTIRIRINPNQSEKRFESRLLKNAWKLIRPRIDFQSEWISVWIDSDWKFSSDSLEFIRIDFKCFSTNEIETIYWIGSNLFALARIQISKWFGIVLISSEWIPLWKFRQRAFLIYRVCNLELFLSSFLYILISYCFFMIIHLCS